MVEAVCRLDLPWLRLPSILASRSVGFFDDSPHTFSLNMVTSSIRMNLIALALNSFNVVDGVLHSLSEKGLGFNTMTIEVSATSRLRSQF